MIKHILPFLFLAFLFSGCGDGLLFERFDNEVVVIKKFEVKEADKWVEVVGSKTITQGSTVAIRVTFTDPEIPVPDNPVDYEYVWRIKRMKLDGDQYIPEDPPSVIASEFVVYDENPCIWRAESNEVPTDTGFYKFTVSITDYHDETTEGGMIAEIITPPNEPPIITSVDVLLGVPPDTSSPKVNEEIMIVACAEDSDGDYPLGFEWDGEGEFVAEFTGDSVDDEFKLNCDWAGVAVWRASESKEYELTVTVTDSKDGESVETVTVFVNPE